MSKIGLKSLVAMVVIIIISMMFSGCGMRDLKPTEYTFDKAGNITGKTMDPLVALAVENKAAETQCFMNQEKKRLDLQRMIDSGKLSEQSLVSMKFSEDMKEMSVKMVQGFTGKNTNECSSGGTNIFDALIAEVQAKNKTVEKVVDGATTVGLAAVIGHYTSKTLAALTEGKGIENNFNNDGDANIDGSFNTTTTTQDSLNKTVDISTSTTTTATSNK